MKRTIERLPDAAAFITTQAMLLMKIPSEKLTASMEALIRVRDELPKNDKRGLIKELRSVAKRFERWADRLEQPTQTKESASDTTGISN